MEVIPAIDLLGGRCVRLHQGDFGKVITYEHDPIELAHACADAGARRLHVVDLDGARSGTPVNIATIEALAALGRIEVQAGGGIRDLARLQSLLAAGAARAVIGSVAIEEPETAFIWPGPTGPVLRRGRRSAGLPQPRAEAPAPAPPGPRSCAPAR